MSLEPGGSDVTPQPQPRPEPAEQGSRLVSASGKTLGLVGLNQDASKVWGAQVGPCMK